MSFSSAQERALAVSPKVVGFASIIFSSIIAVTVLRDKKKRSKVYHRLLLGISCVDISSSFWLGLSTWPIPRDSGILWAAGNDASCSLQGYFTQFGIASSFYNAGLALYYLLVIKYGWREEQVQRIEPLLHAIPILWATGTATCAASLGILESANLWCWISPSADQYRWAFFYGPLWVMIFIVTLNCIFIFMHVRRVEKTSEIYRFREANRFDNMHSSLVSGVNERSARENDYQASRELSLPLDNPPVGKENSQDFEVTTVPAEMAVENDRVATSILSSTEESSVGDGLKHERQKRLEQQRRSSRRKSTVTSRRRSGEVASQCFLYAAAFYLNWTALTVSRRLLVEPTFELVCLCLDCSNRQPCITRSQVTRAIQTVNGKSYFILLLIASMTTPMQGLPNALVYLRPKFMKLRRERPHAGVWNWFRGSLANE